MAAIQATDETFDAIVLKSSIPVLVDFWAEWCSPCRMMTPILDEISAKFGDTVKFVRLDIDYGEQTRDRFEISSLPTLAIFKNGQIWSARSGAMTKAHLIEWLASADIA